MAANDIDVIGGKYFTSLFPTTNGVITAEKLITTDSNKRIDEIIVGNETTQSGRITFNEATNNGSNNVILKAPLSLTNSSTLLLLIVIDYRHFYFILHRYSGISSIKF